MEMASLRPACGSDFRHRAHPLADRRHVAFRRPRRRRAFGLDGWRGQIHRPGAGEVPARCLGPGPDRARRQQAVAGGAIACRQRSQSLARLGRSCCAAASPSMRSGCSSRKSPCATAQRPRRRRRTRHTPCSPRSSAARRCACCMCAKARSCFRASVAAPSRMIYAHLDAGKEAGAVSGFGSFVYKDTSVRYSLESGSVTATGGTESFPLALTLTSKPFRAGLSGTASDTAGFDDRRRHAGRDRRWAQILQMDRHPHSRTATA